MNSSNRYIVTFEKNNKQLKLCVHANDSGHAQAQASDIRRAFDAEKYSLELGEIKTTPLSKLFVSLANNQFSNTECELWQGKFCNGCPCVYAFGERYYLRNLIIKYLDIPRDGVISKPSCACKSCINPYHFFYTEKSRSNLKLSPGDVQMLLAFHSQGVSIPQIAKALNVHRSTIYRKLNEHLSTRTESNVLASA